MTPEPGVLILLELRHHLNDSGASIGNGLYGEVICEDEDASVARFSEVSLCFAVCGIHLPKRSGARGHRERTFTEGVKQASPQRFVLT